MSIATIMTGIEALAPTYDSDVAVRVWGWDNIKDTLNEASCPVRMILAPGDDNGAEMEFVGMKGSTQMTRWRILDRVYLFPVLLGKGIEAYNVHYWNYISSYQNAIKAVRCLGTTDATVRYMSYSNLYARSYPEGSEGAYWVIDVVLEVEEYI